jgi:sugar (glycoside-pentoside-hexuronide) transporter
MQGSQGSEKLKLSTKIGFGMGDIYGGGALVLIGFYYLHFLTDVMGINPVHAGIIFLVSKAWDAITDPVMGIISDRTKSRWGRRRPYFLFGIVLIFISFLAMWYPVDFESEKARFIYMMLGYVFFSTIITMVMIPYNALASELTLDYNERSSLSSIRIFFSTFSSIICAVVPLEITKGFADVRHGYIAMAIVFGLVFALPFIVTFLTTKERKEFKPVTEGLSFKSMFVEPFKIKSFLCILIMYLFSFVAMDSLMAIVIYYINYYMGFEKQANYVLGAMLVMQVLVIPAYYYLSKATSKKTAFAAGGFVWVTTMFFSFLLKPGMSIVVLYLFSMFIGAGTGGIIVMVYSIFPDMPDIDELVSRQRREGLYSGLFTFMRKLSAALAIFLISQAISRAGYKAPVKEVLDGATKMIPQAQSPEFIDILRKVFALTPVVFVIIALIAALYYPLTPAIHARLKSLLERRRAGQVQPEDDTEADELKRLLYGRK